jgi:hypothetical protein
MNIAGSGEFDRVGACQAVEPVEERRVVRGRVAGEDGFGVGI